MGGLTDKAKWTDVAIALLTAGIVFFAWKQTSIFKEQARIFDKQWKEMHDSGTDTHDLAAAAKAQADAARTTAANSERTIKATQNAMRLEQRAWVGAKIVTLPPPPQAPPLPSGVTVLGASVEFTNTGHTPAFNLKIRDVIHQLPSCPAGDQLLPFDKITIPVATAVLPPGDTAYTVPVGDIVVPAPLGGPQWEMYVYGVMTYDDVFGRPHTTEFSAHYRRGAWIWCSTHNTMD